MRALFKAKFDNGVETDSQVVRDTRYALKVGRLFLQAAGRVSASTCELYLELCPLTLPVNVGKDLLG